MYFRLNFMNSHPLYTSYISPFINNNNKNSKIDCQSIEPRSQHLSHTLYHCATVNAYQRLKVSRIITLRSRVSSVPYSVCHTTPDLNIVGGLVIRTEDNYYTVYSHSSEVVSSNPKWSKLGLLMLLYKSYLNKEIILFYYPDGCSHTEIRTIVQHPTLMHLR